MKSRGTSTSQFGWAMASNDTLLIVGAPGDDEDETNEGAAYLIDAGTGTRLFKLRAEVPVNSSRLGRSVGISGSSPLAIAGAPSGDLAYLYNTTTGQQQFKLEPNDPDPSGKSFGIAVAVEGNLAAVGAWGDNTIGPDAGAVYLFDATTGQQVNKLYAPDIDPTDRSTFGNAVAFGGTTLFVGMIDDDDGGSNSGAVYAFNALTGAFLKKYVASDPTDFAYFGWSIDVEGNTLIVGAEGNNTDARNAGAAYLFDLTTGQETHRLSPSDPHENKRFGRSVAISGDTAVIGAYGSDDAGFNAGKAYLFDLTTGQQIDALVASDSDDRDLLGFSAAFAGNTAIAGAYADEDGGFETGSIYFFNAGTPADLSRDGDVDDEDLGLFFSAFTGPDLSQGPLSNPAADLSGDGDVDDEDLGLVFAEFTGPLAPINVPEPASAALLALGALSCTRRREKS